MAVAGLSGTEAHGAPWRVIEKANRGAQINPDSHGYMNAIMQYDYESGQLYQVYCAPFALPISSLSPENT